MNREHCIMGSSRCVAVSPSDTAPALIALDAQFVIQEAQRPLAASGQSTQSGGPDRSVVLRTYTYDLKIRIRSEEEFACSS